MNQIQSDENNLPNPYNTFKLTQLQRVSDRKMIPILNGCELATRLLVLILPQLGDFDSLEYAWWLKRESKLLENKGIILRAIGIGDRASGERFCEYQDARVFVGSKCLVQLNANVCRNWQ
jgi:hypothetical protein